MSTVLTQPKIKTAPRGKSTTTTAAQRRQAAVVARRTRTRVTGVLIQSAIRTAIVAAVTYLVVAMSGHILVEKERAATVKAAKLLVSAKAAYQADLAAETETNLRSLDNFVLQHGYTLDETGPVKSRALNVQHREEVLVAKR
jgi:hypothetical protein